METVYLTERGWVILRWLITHQARKQGGFQNRLREWVGRMDETDRSIRLSTENVGRHTSDIEFIQKAVFGKDKGGWQKHLHDAFVGTHARFTP